MDFLRLLAAGRCGALDTFFSGLTYFGSEIALVMMVLIFLCMWVMNKFDDGSGEEGGLLL